MGTDTRSGRCVVHLEDPCSIRGAEQPVDRKRAMAKNPAILIDRTHRNGSPQTERVDRPSTDEDRIDIVCCDTDKALPEPSGNANVDTRPSPGRQVDPAVRAAHWYDSPTMAKAKRRKLRARRSKANHGRKPNAGRG